MENEHTLKLTDAERETLIETLEGYLKNLSYEISDTDTHDFREMLKGRRSLLQKVVSQLQAS